MEKVITFNFNEDFMQCLGDYIEKNFLSSGVKDLSGIAVVFGGKRPSLFLKKELACRIKGIFYPPNIFSINEFINYILKKHIDAGTVNDLNACYAVYDIAKKNVPEILKGREKFSDFLPWAKEIIKFIDESDMELADINAFKTLKSNAEIGYEIPDSVNMLLEKIILITSQYHKKLKKENTYSHGLKYRTASRIIENIDLSEFKKILFCNFFYLSKSEEKIIRNLYEKNKAVLFFQKDDNKWPVFEDLSKKLNCEIKPQNENVSFQPEIEIKRGFDMHSQVGLVREKLKKTEDLEKTLVVLPDSNSLIPLLSEISSFAGEFNVSMGYPVNRTVIYSLFRFIFKARDNMRKGMFYSKDYLKVLLHPLIKNLRIVSDPAVTRVLVHKIEEILIGEEKTELSGTLFADIKKIRKHSPLYVSAMKTLSAMGIKTTVLELEESVEKLHYYGFKIWDKIKNFSELAKVLEEFLNMLIDKSFIYSYPLNLKIIDKIFAIKDEIENAVFNKQQFASGEIFKIFNDKFEDELISFYGSPLKGLQILGLFETRALRFENVIIMDVNESVLPKIKAAEPLIPRPIMLELGLSRLEREEEIQRYHFMRIISCAKKVFLVYDDNNEKNRSRFLEELIWQKQKEEKKLEVFSEPQAKFKTEVTVPKKIAPKTAQIIKMLKNFKYSATSIDVYLNCPLRFYYKYILKMEEREKMLEDVTGADIGSFMHKLLENAFKEFIGKKPVIDGRFTKKFMESFSREFDTNIGKRLSSEAFMVKDVMKYKLNNFLFYEKNRPVEKIISLEDKSLGGFIKLKSAEINFKCIIDRLDKMEDKSLLIIDYKTGTSAKAPKSLKDLNEMEFSRQNIKKGIYSFQLPLYYYFVRQKYREMPLNAMLYSLKDLSLSPKFTKDIMNADKMMGKCMEALDYIVCEILDPEKTFEADDSNSAICGNCPFFYLCR